MSRVEVPEELAARFEVTRVLVLVHLLGHLPGQPARVHGVDVGVEDHRVEVPDEDRQRQRGNEIPRPVKCVLDGGIDEIQDRFFDAFGYRF
mgnify:CR=1 FL=1